MFIEVVGYAVLSYVNKQGRQVDGLRIYGLEDRSSVFGKATVEAFISGRNITPPEIGSMVRLIFNQYGRCQEYMLVD